MRGLYSALLASVVMVLTSCETVSTTAPGAIGVERKQVMWVSEADVEQSATQAYALEMTKARQAGAVKADLAQTEAVRGPTGLLSPATAAFRPRAAGLGFGCNMPANNKPKTPWYP